MMAEVYKTLLKTEMRLSRSLVDDFFAVHSAILVIRRHASTYPIKSFTIIDE